MSRTHISDLERAAAPHTGVTSLVALLHARAMDAFDRTAVVEPTCAVVGGSPPLTSHTWGALLAAAIDYGCMLEAAGLTRGDRLAHAGPHSVEWIVVDLACLITGIVHVPLHHDETDAGIHSQLAWLSPRGLVCGGRLDAAAAPAFIRMPRPAPLAEPRAADAEAVRRQLADRVEACDPDAPAAFFLSSGTTGRPRAIVHCQRALAWNATAASAVFLDDPRDVRLSWLPLSHASARVGDLYTALVRGGSMCVVGDRRRVLDACSLTRPTVILGVPAFFDRIAAAVVAGRIPDLPAALGGEVRICVSGGAPLRVRTAETFAARGVPLVEGYGLAEAGPVVALASPRTSAPGTVGPPLPGIEVALDGYGQIRVRSPSVALAAIDPDGTTAVAAPDGLLDTGDVGTLDAEGRLRITGRVVDTLVLSNGIKVPPGEVERALAEDPAVAQVCVLGQGLTAPVALVVPEPDVVRAAVRRLGLRVWSRGQALRHPRLLRWLSRRLAARQARLPRAWRARRAVFVARPFDTAHGEATAALKLKRQAIAAHFAHVVRAAAVDEPPSWMTAVPAGRNSTAARGTHDAAAPSLAAAVWQRGDAGFAAAAAAAATPPRAVLEAVLEQVDRTLAILRADGALYDPAPHHAPAAPLDDAPPAPRGRLSATAEARLGDTGLWGLAVPERFGGGGAGMLDLVYAITHVAERTPTAAGLLSVHSSIGAVSALAAFGSPEQQARHFPGLAQGRPLSIFGATEPDAGCDLSRIRTTVEETGAGLVVSGTKMFITGANHGRLVKLLARHAGRPTVVLVRLPDTDTPSFRLRHYALHPLKHAHNAALEFVRFPIDPADILAAPPHRGDGDAMAIIWHGLNRGRITLAAQVAGTLRVMLSQARDHAVNRRTWGAAIASRQLVQGRLGRIAARIAACDAMAAWAAVSVDAGGSGELEAIAAKIVASECVREAAGDALGIHGGRAFLVGHPLGDALHDHLAVTVYEGESDLLGLALFKGLAKRHPLAAARASSALGRAAGWLAWRIGGLARHPHDAPILDAALRHHARRARRSLESAALEIDRAGRRHGAGLAERQLEIGDMSARVRYLVSVLAVAHHADAAADDRGIMAADAWCRLALARADGRRPGPDDLAAVAALGRATAG